MTGKNGGTSTAVFTSPKSGVWGGGATACSLPIAIEPLSFGELWNEILILTVSRRSLSARYQQQAYALEILKGQGSNSVIVRTTI